jgi:hypothetical protein
MPSKKISASLSTTLDVSAEQKPVVRRGPSQKTINSKSYKTTLRESKASSLVAKAHRAKIFRQYFEQLEISAEELTRLLYLLPVGTKPSPSQRSKVSEKLGMYSSENPRQPNMSDILAIGLMVALQEQGVDITQLEFDG